MGAGFCMHGDVIAARFRERFQIWVARRDHQMRVEDLFAVRTDRLDHIWPIGNVGDEMPIHHVEMDPVGAGRIDGADLLAQFGKIRRQDRRRDDEGAWRELLGHYWVSRNHFMGVAEGPRLTCVCLPGNAADRAVARVRKILPWPASIAWAEGPWMHWNPSFYWVAWNGTRFAERRE